MKGRLLVIDDEKLICWSLQKDFSQEGYEVVTAQSAREGIRFFTEEPFDAAVLDIRLPDGDGKEILQIMRKKDPLLSVIMLTANDEIRTAVQCMQLGAFTYLHKPFDFEELKLNIEKAVESKKMRQKIRDWETVERGKYDFDSIVAESPQMKQILELIRRIFHSEFTTVLIEGESGTGKDLLARALHYGSQRASKSFVSINCAALPGPLLESELFGHEKGAFTDAKQAKKGLVEEAQGGTLFLDEIGDMSKDLQAKLLHLIDQKKYRKVGGVKELDADVRIVAATNKGLKSEVAEGRFRQDLYYRLNVVPINIPPLRERKEDIPALVHFFIAHFNREFRRTMAGVHPEAMQILLNYSWPGNIRELKNVIERAMILNRESSLLPEQLPSEIDCTCALKDARLHPEKNEPSNKITSCIVGLPLEGVEKQAIIQTLQSTGGNQSQAARMLGIGRDALRYKMIKFGLLNDNDTPEMGDITHSDETPA